jgi:hypothetical protein
LLRSPYPANLQIFRVEIIGVGVGIGIDIGIEMNARVLAGKTQHVPRKPEGDRDVVLKRK